MKDIFSDIYDKVLSFFTAQNEDESKIVAKSRLRSVLMQDRVGFSERAMQMLKDDLLDSISRYLEINVDSFDLSIDATEDATILNLSIPVLRPKTDDEIDEALSIQEKVKIEKTEEIVGELEVLVKEKAQALAQSMAEEPKEEVKEENKEAKEEAKEEQEEKKEEVKTKTSQAVTDTVKAEKSEEVKKTKKKNTNNV